MLDPHLLPLPIRFAAVALLALPLQTAPSKPTAAPVAAASAKANLPKVRLVATGGTIAGAQASPEQHGYTAGAFDINALIGAVPQLKDLARVSGEQVMNIGSQNMTNADWLKLARRLEELEHGAGDQGYDGFVVTHGTDTMEETSYFVDLTVSGEKPIVFSGSMRPATAISPDGPMNLYNAVAVAGHAQAKGCGALVVMDDEIHAARNVYKTNTSRVETFASVDRGPAGLVDTGHPDFFGDCKAQRPAKPFLPIGQIKALPRVDILYAHAGMGRDLIDAAVKGGAKGLVIAGVGNGNATDEAMAGLKDARARGVVVVRSTRVESGTVARNAEVDDDKLGFATSSELKPSKARVLLMLALLKTKEPLEIQKIFDSN